MTTFNYVKKDGTLGTFQATDSNVALKSLPVDATPTSGVMFVKDTVLSGTVSKPISTPVQVSRTAD